MTVNLGKKLGFDNAGNGSAASNASSASSDDSADALAAAQKALAEALAGKQAAEDSRDEALAGKKAAEDSLEALRNQPKDTAAVAQQAAASEPLVLYYAKGSSTPTVLEQQHLLHYLQNMDKSGTFTVTGSADSSTGTLEFNQKLCQSRVDSIVSLLHEAGISDDQIVIKDSVIDDSTDHPEMSRAVIVEH